MAKISWVTPPGIIDNLLVNLPASVEIIAADDSNNGYTLTYDLSSGALPNGMHLTSVNISESAIPQWVGVISGTPTSLLLNSSTLSKSIYNFVIRVRSSNSDVLPSYQGFSITLSNIVNNNFAWITPSGSLGTIPNGQFYSLQLQAETNTGNPITYSFVSGELPTGMQLLSTGFLQGVPEFLNPVVVDQNQTFRFTVRASTGTSNIIDRSFNLSVTNVFGPTIEPNSTFLGEVFDGSYYSQQLTVFELNPAVQIQWSIKDGQLPPGVMLSSSGLLFGYIDPLELIGRFGPHGYDSNNTANIGVTATLSNCTISGTTLRVGSYSGTIEDQLYLTGNGVSAGTYIVGQLYAGDMSGHNSEWTVTPSQNILSNTAISGTVLTAMQQQEYDFGPYDFNEITQNVSYSFTVQAFDGANYDTQNYILNIVSRPGYTADSSNTINNTFLTTDATNVYYPIIKNADVKTLPNGRQGSYYAYKFDGFDFNGDPVTYSISNTIGCFDTYVQGQDIGFDNLAFDSFDSNAPFSINLPGISLDSNTGWLYGNISPQVAAIQDFTFGVVVSKVQANVKYSSDPIFFTLPVLGDVNNTIQWVTPSNLGTIDHGTVSELYVQAVSPINAELIYSIYDVAGQSAALPQGLSFLPSGEISGRVSFEAFTIDDFTTTFDKNTTTVDRTFNFTVFVQTADGSATSTRVFTLKLNVIDPVPFENLYLQAMPAFDQRQTYSSIISDTEIFDPAIIYRADDPWFGIQQNMQMLFLSGLSANTLDAYETAITENHWTKTYNFNGVKTASVLDSNFNVKYEVVYIEVDDPSENANGKGPVKTVDLTNVIAHPYIDAEGGTHTIVHPNSSANMIADLEAGIGYADQSSLPPWMTSNQPNPGSKTTFLHPLGFTKAVVVAYTKPGAAKLIAYRLKNAGINFSNIDFTVDRYEVDDYYTTNFNPVTDTYIPGKETTFDLLPAQNVGNIIDHVTYAVTVPFSEINGRPVSYINAAGGIDGITGFQTGDTLVFAKQEHFAISAPYDGWVDFTDSYIGDNITTLTIEGYDSEGYDEYSVVPGYLEFVQQTSPVNQRGGVWQINIVNNTVYLSFVTQINPGDRIQILAGKTYASAILYYSKNYPANSGLTVPFYQVYAILATSLTKPTTFNNGSTRFISHRDQYYTPGSQDKYLKFPQYGVFK
jgi:hypothetical protein